jgi:hypothetical protein
MGDYDRHEPRELYEYYGNSPCGNRSGRAVRNRPLCLARAERQGGENVAFAKEVIPADAGVPRSSKHHAALAEIG